MTVEITVNKIGPNEIRVTLTADLRISGDLSTLSRREDARPVVGSAGDKASADIRGKELLTVDQTAEVLHISRDRVYDLIRTRHLRSIKIGRLRRIAPEWIAEFVLTAGDF